VKNPVWSKKKSEIFKWLAFILLAAIAELLYIYLCIRYTNTHKIHVYILTYMHMKNQDRFFTDGKLVCQNLKCI